MWDERRVEPYVDPGLESLFARPVPDDLDPVVRAAQAATVLALLLDRGDPGVLSTEAVAIGVPRLQRAVEDLRHDGWPVQTRRSDRGRLRRYVLPPGSVQGPPSPRKRAGLRAWELEDGRLIVEVAGTSRDKARAEYLAGLAAGAMGGVVGRLPRPAGLREEEPEPDLPEEEHWLDQLCGPEDDRG